MESRIGRGLIGLVALLVAGLMPLAAHAATLYLSEYNSIGSTGSSLTPFPPGAALATQTVAVGGGSVQSAVFNNQTRLIGVTCDIGCSVLIGTNPTATTSTTLQQQGTTAFYAVASGQRIAVIANPAGDLPGGGGGSSNVAVTSVVPGTGATNLGKAEDSPAGATGDVGVAVWGVRNDANASQTTADLDYGSFNIDASGRQKMSPDGGCNLSAVVNVTAANTTQIVALSGTTVIRVCSIAVSMTAAGTVTFTSGTGTNCGTGTTPLSGAMSLATGSPLSVTSGTGSVLRTAAGNAFCITAATGNVTGFITYAQY